MRWTITQRWVMTSAPEPLPNLGLGRGRSIVPKPTGFGTHRVANKSRNHPRAPKRALRWRAVLAVSSHRLPRFGDRDDALVAAEAIVRDSLVAEERVAR